MSAGYTEILSHFILTLTLLLLRPIATSVLLATKITYDFPLLPLEILLPIAKAPPS